MTYSYFNKKDEYMKFETVHTLANDLIEHLKLANLDMPVIDLKEQYYEQFGKFYMNSGLSDISGAILASDQLRDAARNKKIILALDFFQNVRNEHGNLSLEDYKCFTIFDENTPLKSIHSFMAIVAEEFEYFAAYKSYDFEGSLRVEMIQDIWSVSRSKATFAAQGSSLDCECCKVIPFPTKK